MRPDPESMGIFTGFKIEYPIYDVVLPQSGASFSVRGLTVSEVSKLKTSLTTPAKSTDLINKTIWASVVNKPKGYNTFDDFMKGTTLKDREALIYATYVTTFGEDREFNVVCTSCGAERALKIRLSDMFVITPYEGSNAMLKTYQVARDSDGLIPDPEMESLVMEKKMKDAQKRAIEEANAAEENKEESEEDENDSEGEKEQKNKKKKKTTDTSKTEDVSDILVAETSVFLPVSKVNAIIHQPKLIDEHDIMNEIAFAKKKDVDLVNETLIIKRFEVLDPTTKNVKMIIREREDILRGYQSLPNIDRKNISDTYLNTFAKYGIELKSKWDCLECDNENTLDLDIVRLFFRMVTTS